MIMHLTIGQAVNYSHTKSFSHVFHVEGILNTRYLTLKSTDPHDIVALKSGLFWQVKFQIIFLKRRYYTFWLTNWHDGNL